MCQTEGQALNCALCSEETAGLDSCFCSIHARGLENLRIAHKRWNASYDGMSLEDFLKKIGSRPETGLVAKAVARHELAIPSRWKESKP